MSDDARQRLLQILVLPLVVISAYILFGARTQSQALAQAQERLTKARATPPPYREMSERQALINALPKQTEALAAEKAELQARLAGEVIGGRPKAVERLTRLLQRAQLRVLDAQASTDAALPEALTWLQNQRRKAGRQAPKASAGAWRFEIAGDYRSVMVALRAIASSEAEALPIGIELADAPEAGGRLRLWTLTVWV